ncbi:MAG: crossover junction endodeoxyribonuclease RuvC [Alphaproteobacteria bacterium CG11_big_fil_rev_8_21_14_0_20_39_49]|nr:MAG: crossover junction endodeoxyribonuclease RuvC [Alphaproteobacteria bacterium CG11_big_fil_rev_8_21_14_0_20_39_49]
MNKILGIDPGLGHTGWGVISKQDNKISFIDCGVISSNPKENLALRLLTIKNGLQEVIQTYSPDQCAIEETFVNKNPLSSLKLGHARGAAILTCSLNGLNPYEYAATLVKKTIVGAGRAEKSQIAMMVKTLLPRAVIKSEDAADALAVAICHCQHSAINKLLATV